jgi:hypothetical protein
MDRDILRIFKSVYNDPALACALEWPEDWNNPGDKECDPVFSGLEDLETGFDFNCVDDEQTPMALRFADELMPTPPPSQAIELAQLTPAPLQDPRGFRVVTCEQIDPNDPSIEKVIPASYYLPAEVEQIPGHVNYREIQDAVFFPPEGPSDVRYVPCVQVDQNGLPVELVQMLPIWSVNPNKREQRRKSSVNPLLVQKAKGDLKSIKSDARKRLPAKRSEREFEQEVASLKQETKAFLKDFQPGERKKRLPKRFERESEEDSLLEPKTKLESETNVSKPNERKRRLPKRYDD